MPLAVEPQKKKITPNPKTNWVQRHAGADVLNQPKIYIINPAEGSHISPVYLPICFLFDMIISQYFKEAIFYGKVYF